jgi:uncharacterized coiled-coil DUF342 family protein
MTNGARDIGPCSQDTWSDETTAEIQRLERDLSAAHQRINEMIREIDRCDELIFDLQRRIEELERVEGRSG